MILLDCKKALYIGCGYDLLPVNTLKHIPEWTLIDGNPCKTYSSKEQIDNINGNKDDDRIIMLMNHIEKFVSLYSNIGFEQVKVDYNFRKCELKNKTTNQYINYYFNTRFEPTEKLSKEIIDNIKQTDAIVIIGYAPHYSLLKYLNNKTVFIGSSSTYYGNVDEKKDENEPYNCLYPLHRSKLIQKFDEMYILNRKPFEDKFDISFDDMAQYVKIDTFQQILCENRNTNLKMWFKN